MWNKASADVGNRNRIYYHQYELFSVPLPTKFQYSFYVVNNFEISLLSICVARSMNMPFSGVQADCVEVTYKLHLCAEPKWAPAVQIDVAQFQRSSCDRKF